MSVKASLFPLLMSASFLLFGGCAKRDQSNLMAKFSGKWVCNNERTDELQMKHGVSKEEIEVGKQYRKEHPEWGKSHEDIVFSDDVASTLGWTASEYKFFHMHKHGDTLCGKAWFHEDRNDPGDMSECRVKLSLVNDELHFQLRTLSGPPNLDDYDAFSEPPFTIDPAVCDAENPKGTVWEPWTYFVFERAK